MNVKKHYDNHLGNFYSWMVGDFHLNQKKQQDFYEKNNLIPQSSKIAFDLGCGHGLHSISLENLGFHVKAIDFNKQLLDELKNRAEKRNIEIFNDDIRNIKNYNNYLPEIIICCGDTLTHLETLDEVNLFIQDSCFLLDKNGIFVLSFRDYSYELKDTNRFIHVKSDENNILTCFLEYDKEKVTVTDIFYTKKEDVWEQKISSYSKIRIKANDIIDILSKCNMKIILNESLNGLITIISKKN